MKSTAGDLNKDEICFKLTIDGQSIGDEITSIDQAISAVAVINKAHGETVALVNTPTVESEDEAGGGVLLNQHLKYKIQAPISHAAIAVAPWQSIIFG